MDVPFRLYTPFVSALNRMKEKYGETFERLNGFHNSNLNYTDFIDNFVESDNVANATIDSNSNANSKDICSLISEMHKPHSKLLAFNKIFYELTKKYGLETAQKWLEEEWNGSFYLHDAYDSSFRPYCFAYDLDDLAKRGLYFVNNFNAEPPKHLTTFTDFVGEFVSWTSNRSSGAVGLPSFLIYSFYFWKKDVEDGYYIKTPEYYRNQEFQRIIYKLNQPYLRVNQSAFTNFTIMDRPYLEEMFGGREYPDGTFVIDYIEDIIEYQKSFMEVCSEIRQHNVMTFPVLTYSLLYKDGKFTDEDFARWCNRHNMKWCDSNFFISEDVTILSSCCRLLSNFTKLKGFVNSIGGTALKIGSIKVNTINLNRISIECNGSKDKYIEILSSRVDTCIKTLDVIRHIIKRNVEKGLLPNYSLGIMDMKNQFSTIGIIGMNQAIETMGGIREDEFGNSYYTNEGVSLAVEIMDKINELKDEYDFDYSINIEAIPGERAASILYEKDKLLFPEIPDRIMYSNQWISLDTKCTLDEKIKLSSILDKKCGGGNILHVNSQGEFASEEQAWDLLNYIASKGVIYFAYNIKINACKNNHGFTGVDTCPICGEPVYDTYQRIVGFLTPSKSYSKERKEEFSHRYWYDLND